MAQSESIAKLAAALVAVQPKLKHPHKNGTNPHLRNKFADLNSVIDANREVLAEAGLVVIQLLSGGTDPGQWVGVETIILHSSGEYISELAKVEVREMKGLNIPQCVGVSTTYLRRYGWQTILGLSGDDDADGNEANGEGGKRQPAAAPASANALF